MKSVMLASSHGRRDMGKVHEADENGCAHCSSILASRRYSMRTQLAMSD